MKKFCFIFLINLILFFSGLSVSNAQHVRVADVGVTNFVQSMQEDIYYANFIMEKLDDIIIQDIKESFQLMSHITILNPVRNTSIDKSGYYGYISRVIDKETKREKTRFLFYSNAQGYLDNISIICYNPEYDAKFAGGCLALSMVSLLEMNKDEMKRVFYALQNKIKDSSKKDDQHFNVVTSIYCKAKQRYFDFHFYECNKNHFHFNISARN